MSRADPAEQAVLRLEARRFASRCDAQIALVQRADTLRELSRLSRISIPYRLSEDFFSRDAQRHVTVAAEQRAREIIQEQIQHFIRAEPEQQEKLKHQTVEDWANLSGALGHLRVWAQGKLLAAQQVRPLY
jgi:hypothetical protein